MKPNLLRTLCGSTVVLVMVAVAIQAQDFTRSYPMGAGASVSVRTVSGNVKVTGYAGEAIVVVGHKEGRDREMVQIQDRSTASRVDVIVSYPDNCNCDASVNFEVQVPRSIRYQFDSFGSVSGDVQVANVAGDLRARSVSGNVTVKDASGKVDASSTSGNVTVEDTAGSVSAKSTSGEVRVDITRLEGTDRMDFTSVSGDVKVRLPASLDADVEMSVMSGDIKTDFALQIEDRGNGPGRRARGQVGSGSRQLRLSSVSGNVSLLKL
jgi:putative adhesin